MAIARFRAVICVSFLAQHLLYGCLTIVRAGDSPTEDDQILQTWAALEESKFRSSGLYSLGVTEQRARVRERMEETRMKGLWYRAEGRSFARLSSDILDDTETFRARRDKLREASETAARFTQAGVALPMYRARFADLVMMTAFRDDVRERMRREIGPIAPADFVGHKLFDVVSANGDLDAPPPSLIAKRGNIDGEALFRRVREDWLAVAASVEAGREPSEERLASIWSACDDWEEAFLRQEENPSPAATNYVDNLRRLAAAAASPSERADMAAFLKDGGHAFEGGTYGDLMFHVLKHRLYPRAGTPGSLAVAELVQAMTDRANVEIAELDTKLEQLKRQNPAHNAVLRERMVPRYFADKSSVGVNAGLNSPAYSD